MTYWVIRIDDCDDFINSKFPIWGINTNKNDNRSHYKNNQLKNKIKTMKEGDILWFATKKINGGKMLGVAEFCLYYDKINEPLININTKTNKEMGWSDDKISDIQIQYCNLYITERQNICSSIQRSGEVFEYSKIRRYIREDLELHYKNFKYYAEPTRYRQ
uniref:EVE domain-containing protein n=1 Tax=viral metagenome TaxID=1070528 RepID=A0A6C0BBH9_9ZZZZ